MGKALALAETAALHDEIPVGAALYHPPTHTWISEAHNATTTSGPEVLQGTPLAHAELLAITLALKKHRQPFLSDCTLYVTLEPCPLCAAALSMVRLGTLVFGAYNPKGGAITHGPRLYESDALSYKPHVVEGVRAEEAGKLLKAYFQTKRG